MKTAIMFIGGPGLGSGGHIGRVRFSKTRRTIYYGDLVLSKSTQCFGKANCFAEHTQEEYWVSNPKKSGQDTLYPGIIEIDEDVREEYWREIRERPDLVETTSFRSEGKYSKRKPS